MARKKHLEDLDAYELGYIDGKMNERVKIDNLGYEPVQLKNLFYKLDIKCKNEKQKDFLKLLKDTSKQIVVGSGAAGSGKSWIAYSYALSQLKDEGSSIEQIVVFIPCAQAGSKEISLGYLKGDIDSKTIPFCEASISTMEKILKLSGNSNPKNIVDGLRNSGKIQFKFLNFSRGSSIDNALIVVEESENLSKQEMLLILTRLGTNSKFIIIGDELQKDRKDIKNEDSGMIESIKRLEGLDEFVHIEFTNDDIVRNPLISKIIERWK